MKRKLLFLKEWRVLRDFTQEQLAEAIETSGATISRWERGRANWQASALVALATALRCEPADLFWDPGGPDFQTWQMIRALRPAALNQALRVLSALIDQAAE